MRVAVIGLGRFGLALARELREAQDVQLLAIERERGLVDRLNAEGSWVAHFQDWDVEHLAELGIDSGLDVAVVAVGEDAEAGQRWVVTLMDMGVRSILARAQNDTQAEVMGRLLGTAGEDTDHRVIRPEHDAARRLAHQLMLGDLADVMELRGSEHSVAVFQAPERLHGKTIADAGIRRDFDLNVLRLRRASRDGEQGGEVIPVGPDDVVEEGDEMTVLGLASRIRRFLKRD